MIYGASHHAGQLRNAGPPLSQASTPRGYYLGQKSLAELSDGQMVDADVGHPEGQKVLPKA
jgi:hypothetical protein